MGSLGGMAAIIERTTTDEIADALRSLSDAERHINDVRAHLVQALSQPTPEPGTVAQARRVTNIVAGCVAEAQRHIRNTSEG